MDATTARDVVAHLWSRDGPLWDRAWVPTFRTFAEGMLSRASLVEGNWVLDVGCGTGLATLMAARVVGPGGRVVGVDRAPGMLRLARQRAKAEGLRQVTFRQGDVEELTLPTKSFDRAVSNCGISGLGLPRSLRNLHRALVPGGLLSFDDWYSSQVPFFGACARVLQEYQRPTVPKTLTRYREALVVMDRHEARYRDPSSTVEALEAAGFVDVHHEVVVHEVTAWDLDSFMEARLGRVYTAAEVKAMGPQRGQEFQRALRRALEPFVRGERLHIPWEMHYFTARRR